MNTTEPSHLNVVWSKKSEGSGGRKNFHRQNEPYVLSDRTKCGSRWGTEWLLCLNGLAQA